MTPADRAQLVAWRTVIDVSEAESFDAYQVCLLVELAERLAADLDRSQAAITDPWRDRGMAGNIRSSSDPLVVAPPPVVIPHTPVSPPHPSIKCSDAETIAP